LDWKRDKDTKCGGDGLENLKPTQKRHKIMRFRSWKGFFTQSRHESGYRPFCKMVQKHFLFRFFNTT